MKEVDIIVDYGYQWMYDTTGTQWVNFPYSDFYAVLLHELGHAHLLDHISDPLALMYFAQLQTPIQPADRPIYLNTEISCKEGGDYVLFRSGAVTYGNCIAIDTLIPQSGYGCTPFNAVEETAISHNIAIYPNPFENNIQIVFWRDIPYFQVEIYDITGQRLYEKKCTNTAQQEIDLSLLPQGVYYLKLHNNLFNYQQIIIKQ
jgi:hypothetical protein